MVWFVPLIWGVSAVATAFAGVKVAQDIKEIKVAEQENTTERIAIEDRRQARIINSPADQIASSTATIGDDIVLFARKFAFPIILVIGGIVVLIVSMWGAKK